MKHQPTHVRTRFEQCFFGDIAISAVTLAELEYGVACTKERAQENASALAQLLTDIWVAPFEALAAKAYGPVRAANRVRQTDALDKLIAAHALALGAILVTNNLGDFKKYAGLVLENWAQPGQ
jgi:tRNA(fMet)-specific endonuclease VapC